ncbi:MAG TPA: aldo/keto reductase [Usitatibacter sp.]|nr:aldo/keto reductase [Usitatibacter sp.]
MDRRNALGFLAASGVLAALPAHAQPAAIHSRPVPTSGERIPVVGLGTWLTFDVGGADSPARRVRGDVLRAFFAAGGRLVDSSPMYGTSEEVIGAELGRVQNAPLFSATKVWTVGGLAGRRQMESSRALWRVQRFDLMQVHNLLDWETHWPTLKSMKAEGRVRHIGMTTSHGRRHDDLEKILRRDKLDFVQLTYNVNDRRVEEVLLPLAAERGVAVIVNRPFDGGDLFGAKTAKPLPGWARELQCGSWAEALLKWVVAHPAVTCAIPATSKPAHLAENMRALAGPLPDAALRRRMAEDYARA